MTIFYELKINGEFSKWNNYLLLCIEKKSKINKRCDYIFNYSFDQIDWLLYI